MELNLTRPLLFFDIESTGLEIAKDCIIELSFLKVFPGNPEPEVKTWRIKPWDYEKMQQKPISKEASKVNGITDDMLFSCPKFIEVAPEVCLWLKDSDLAGFNAAKFDLPLLAEELERVKAYSRRRIADFSASPAQKRKAEETLKALDIDLHEPKLVDVQNIYHYMEPRNLRAAYRFYCGGEDFENAHSAEADTRATYEVLKAQLDLYKEPAPYREHVLRNDIDSMSALVGRKYVDFAGHLIYDGSGEKGPEHILVNFGKHKNTPVSEVYKKDFSYFDWIDKGSFPLDTKAVFKSLRKQMEEAGKAPASQEALAGLKEKWGGGKPF